LRLRDGGLSGSLEELRARAYLDALLDRDSAPPPDTDQPHEQAGAAGHDFPAAQLAPPAAQLNPLFARLNLTVPLTTLLAANDEPGDVAGFGPVDPQLARELAGAAAANPATRWCVTVTGEDGRAAAHGCGRGQPPRVLSAFRDAGAFTLTVSPLAQDNCDHRYLEPGYQPSRWLRHLITARTPTCTAPGCRRPAARCDLDHTVPYDQGGLTCECGLAPLCRHHHRCKQSEGWHLDQPQPGVMYWTTPAGRKYASTAAGAYP
jgi:hypothetical protein